MFNSFGLNISKNTETIQLIENFSFMKMKNLYNRFQATSTSRLMTCLLAMLFTFGVTDTFAQCTLACNDHVQVSLDDDCVVIIKPTDILEGDEMECAGEALTVELVDEHGVNHGDEVDAENIGQTLTVSVISASGNSCWGTLLVEDKLAPVLMCDTVYTTCAS